MIANGVDGLTTLHEFRVSARVRRQLWDKWGTPTLDRWASRKLQMMLDRFCANGGGEGTVGDARSVPLKGEFLWVVPAITMIAYALTRMQQEGAKGIMVVPLWRTQPYYVWRMQMKAEWVCPWSRTNPIIGYGDGAAHEMNRYQFVAWLVDVSAQGPVVLTTPVMVGRQKVLVEVGTSRRTHPAKKNARKQGRGVAVLSLFDGVCCGLLALHRAGIAVKEYWRVENDYWCNKVAER